MQAENLIALMQDVKTVAVKFKNTPNQTYAYKVKPEWNVQVGDELIVRSPRDGTTVVEVVELHDVADISLDSTIKYKWAVQKVDNVAYDLLVKEEEAKAVKLRELQRKAEIKKQVAEMVAGLGDEAAEFLVSLQTK